MDDGAPLEEGHIVAGRYRVVREVGRGGMARVYEAIELITQRSVALKILRPELAALVTRKRFLREVDIVSRLSHPNVLPILSSGEAENSLFFTMPLLTGGTLRDRLTAQGQLAIPDVLIIAQAIGESLDYAAGEGIVHRDVKPENILFEADGRPVLADFGIARAVDQAAGEQLTYSQFAIGTAAYMSPEQHVAQSRIDARADQYAFATVLYEMLAGTVPYTGPTPQAIFARKTVDPIPSLRAVRREVPEAMELAIARALAVTPADRFPTLAALNTALVARSPVAGRVRYAWLGVGAFAIAALVMLFLRNKPPGPSMNDQRRVAVLPFENVSGDSTLDVVGLLAADWISEGLSRTGVVQVVPTPTVLEMRATVSQPASTQTNAAANRIGKLLRADVLVTGTLYVRADSIRVQSQVFNLKPDSLLGAPLPLAVDRRDPMAAIEQLRTRVMGLMAIVVDPQIVATAGTSTNPPTFEAYRAFSRGLEEYVKNDFRSAISQFQAAIETDSTFLIPLLFASISRSNLGQYASADSLARRMSLGSNTLSPYHRAWLEYRLRLLAGDRATALTTVRSLAALNPGSKATYNYAVEAYENGYVEEARIALRKLDIDNGPMAQWIPWWDVMGSCNHLAKDYAAEAVIGAEARRRFPRRLFAFLPSVRALAAQGNFTELQKLLATAAELPRDVYGTSFGSILLEAAKETSAHHGPALAKEFFERARIWYSAEEANNAEALAYVYYELNDLESARRTLERYASAQSAPPRAIGLLGVISVARGDSVTAKRLCNRLAADHRPYGFGEARRAEARIRAALGEPAAAIILLRRAFREGLGRDHWTHTTREFQVLSGNPEFRELIGPR